MRSRVRTDSRCVGNPEMCTAWEGPLMENLVLYRSICWGGSWLDMVRGEAERESDTRAKLTLNPNSASAPNCSKEHHPTESVECEPGKRTKLHERAPNSKTN